MDHALEFVERFGGAVVFVVVFLDQLGLPIPTLPILLAFGALAGIGRIDPALGLLSAVAASLCADLLWFLLGRWQGVRVLRQLCRIALEPDTCVSHTQDLFARHGVKSLLVAKFIPGFDTVAPPLAGLLGVRVVPFVLWSGAGALLWLVAFGGLGYVFSDRLELLADTADQLGGTLVFVVVGLLCAYVAWKYQARRRVLRSIRMARITPDELHALIVSGQQPVIVDARSTSALEALPVVIPGSLRMTLDEVDARHHEIPGQKDVIVYCTCPNELSSARVALRLKRFGALRVRPLAGGIEAWQARMLPVVPIQRIPSVTLA